MPRVWQLCGTCGGTGYTYKRNRNGTFTVECRGCKGAGGKYVEI